LPRQDHVSINIDQLVRFYKNEFDAQLCKLESTENLQLFEKYTSNPTLNWSFATQQRKATKKETQVFS